MICLKVKQLNYELLVYSTIFIILINISLFARQTFAAPSIKDDSTTIEPEVLPDAEEISHNIKENSENLKDSIFQEMTIKDLKLICRDKKFKFTNISQMKQLSSLLKQNMDNKICPSRFTASILELGPIIETIESNPCDSKSIEAIKEYHFRFIQPHKHANRRPTQYDALPRDVVKRQMHSEPRKYTVEFDEFDQAIIAPLAVRHFFLAFALQLSAKCKLNLLANLKEDAQKYLNENDYEVMLIFDLKNPLGQTLLKEIDELDFDSILYIPELDGIREGHENNGKPDKKIYMKTSTKAHSSLYNMIAACRNKFKPIYEKLFMPIIILSKLGYDYQGKELLTEIDLMRLRSVELKSWLGIVHVCQMFEKVVVTTDIPNRSIGLGRAPPKAIELTSKEEVEGQTEAEIDIDSKSKIEAKTQPEIKSKETVTSNEAEEQQDNTITSANLDTSEEGKLIPMDTNEILHLDAEDLANEKTNVIIGQPIDYQPTIKIVFDDRLAIQGTRQLDLELSRKKGHINPFGLRGFFRRFFNRIKWAVAKLDFERFTHYRRNSLWYSGVLNFISSCSNVASITVTLVFTGLTLSG